MIVSYDRKADAATIYIAPKDTASASMYPCDPNEVGAIINLDFDAKGRLISIEVLNASAKLPAALLSQAEQLHPAPPATPRERALVE